MTQTLNFIFSFFFHGGLWPLLLFESQPIHLSLISVSYFWQLPFCRLINLCKGCDSQELQTNAVFSYDWLLSCWFSLFLLFILPKHTDRNWFFSFKLAFCPNPFQQTVDIVVLDHTMSHFSNLLENLLFHLQKTYLKLANWASVFTDSCLFAAW